MARNCSFSCCYNIGEIACNPTNSTTLRFVSFGGIIGGGADNEADNCYYSDNINPRAGGKVYSIEGVSPIEVSKMTVQASYAGFDFENVWKMSSISGYPVFRTEKAVVREQIDIRYKEAASPFVHGEAEIVSWTAEPEGIAELDANGRIVGASAGSASIKLTLSDGTTASCKVNVSYSFIQWLIRIFLFGWIWY